MGAAFTAEGLVTLAGSRLYTSMADTDEVVDDALAGFERVLSGAEGVEGSEPAPVPRPIDRGTGARTL
jgi:hypothetical protein